MNPAYLACLLPVVWGTVFAFALSRPRARYVGPLTREQRLQLIVKVTDDVRAFNVAMRQMQQATVTAAEAIERFHRIWAKASSSPPDMFPHDGRKRRLEG